jgi:tetrahydromethanopterin S-methyltransferase subunit G
MTSAQFYFAIGLPIFSILLVWLGSTVANNRAINALGQRIDDLSKRIDDLGQGLGQRIDDLRSEMRAGFAAVNERIDRLETRFDRVEDEVRKDHEGRLSRLEARVFSRTA